MTTLLEAALKYAAEGIAVFPCQENGKEPACANGFKDATTDPERVRALWHNPDFNIAICPQDAGWLVVDLDVSPEKDGTGTWAKLCAERGWKPNSTYSVETPRGGRHLYYAGSAPSTVNKLGTGIDTRGRGGYVLVPPSRVNGKPYRVVSDHDIADAPHGLAAALDTSATAVRAASGELDTPGSTARARTLLADLVRRGDVAVKGRGADNRTYQLACELLNLGLSPEMACELLTEIWYPHCTPNDKPEFIERKVEHATRYAQNEPGAWNVPPA